MDRLLPTFLALLAFLCALLAPGAARAQVTEPDGSASVAIIQPLKVVKYDDLDFGLVTVTGAGDATITLDPNAAPSSELSTTGPVTVRDAHAARFGGATVKKTGIIVRVPKGDVTITRVGGSETLTIRDFTLEGDPRKQLSAGSVFDFRVGGTLDIPDGTIDGAYEGTFAIEVQYP